VSKSATTTVDKLASLERNGIAELGGREGFEREAGVTKSFGPEATMI